MEVLAGTVKPDTEKLLLPATAVKTGVDPVQLLEVIEGVGEILRLASRTSVKLVLVMAPAVGLLKVTLRLVVPPCVMVVLLKDCDTVIEALAVAEAEDELGLFSEFELMSVAVTAELLASVLVNTSPTAAAAGMLALTVIVQVPADVPEPATTVPPVQVTDELPAAAFSVPPEHPAPKALPADSTI